MNRSRRQRLVREQARPIDVEMVRSGGWEQCLPSLAWNAQAIKIWL